MAVEQTTPQQTPDRYTPGQTIFLFTSLEAAQDAVTKSKWVLEGACARIVSDRRIVIGGDEENPGDVYDLTVSPFVDEEKRIRLALSIFGTTINESDREINEETDSDVTDELQEINRDRGGVIFATLGDTVLGSYQFSRRSGVEASSPGISLPLKPEDLVKVELHFDIH